MSNSPLVQYTRLTKNRTSPRGSKIDTITIHCIVGQWTAKQGCDYFATTDRRCSANYVVGKDGSIGLSVEEKDRSWCSSSSANDNRAITIEVASDTTHPYAVTDAAYNALIDLCTDICQRNGIKQLLWKADKNLIGQPDKQNLTVHRWFANKACPGEYLYNRHGEIAAAVNKRLSAAPTTTPATPAAPTKALYRVRKTWADSKSQKGAFAVLTNAQKCADENPGYSVFDANGVAIYPKAAASTDNSTDKAIWDFFTGKGLNAYAVAGIMGNLYAESALRPTNLQNSYEKKLGHTDDSYTKAVDNGTYTNFVKDSAGYGLAQWTYWSRKQALLEYAQKAKKSIGDLAMQLEFMWTELQGYTSVMKTLKTATSIQAASDAILTGYERPADQGSSVKAKRASYGKQYYDKYAAAGSTTPAPAPSSSLPYRVKITASVLNIRKGPGTNYGKNGSIRDKGVYTIVDESTGTGATKWGKLKSGAGWISLDYCKKL